MDAQAEDGGPHDDAGPDDGSPGDAAMQDAGDSGGEPCALADACDDLNPCTDDFCDAATGACENTANSAACDDANECTLIDVCADGICTGGIAPELCDGIDNDCDAATDESLDQSCAVTNAEGTCIGTEACVAGTFSGCTAVTPAAESCDDADNDCDGTTDESLSRMCTVSNPWGTCTGRETCSAGAYAGCTAAVPGAEICDTIDNDCDGLFDEAVMRMCSVTNGFGTCDGVEACLAGLFVGCTAPTPTVEVCDGADNDCDGATDEAVTRSCSVTNAFGTCSGIETCTGGGFAGCDATAPASDVCDAVDNDCDGAIEEDYVPSTCGVGICSNVGMCALGVDSCVPGPALPTDEPDDLFLDTNCDGIDGDISRGWFVATDGDDADPGTMTSPFRTIQHGIDSASTGQHVYVSEGTYDEQITLSNGVSLWGGYSRSSGWTRSPIQRVTITNSIVVSGRLVAVSGQNILSATIVADVAVETADASDPAATNYAIHCNNCDGLRMRGLTIRAGAGGRGIDGPIGVVGADSTDTGDDGLSGSCDGAAGAGGAGGMSPCGNDGGAGGAGGAEGCNDGVAGLPGVTGTPGGVGGLHENSGCFGGAQGRPGSDGANGSNGGNGADGSGGSGGLVSGAFWASSSGGNATDGGHGNGGGGGGGGGAQCGCAVDDGGGNGAGGGGAGGCGGGGGVGGGGGGGSFGLFLLSSTGVQVTACTITSGTGGGGGSGSSGAVGGAGSSGGIGATVCVGEVGAGGNGGDGGGGGLGGDGGGGAGGPSYAVYLSGTLLSLPATNILMFGTGGVGGSSPGTGGAMGTSGPFN